MTNDNIWTETLIRELQDFSLAYEQGELHPSEMPQLKALENLIYTLEQYNIDWDIQLIHEDNFIDYTKDLIDECYPDIFPDNDNWPARHMTMDYEAAAEELRSDYTTVEYLGSTYYYQP